SSCWHRVQRQIVKAMHRLHHSALIAVAFVAPLAAQNPPQRQPQQPARTPIKFDTTMVGDTSLFAPLNLPPGNEFRSGSGMAGPKYWQNRADYDIRATLDTGAKTLKGEETLRYTNNAPDTLRFLWTQVEQNAFKNGSLNSYVFPSESRFGAGGLEGGDVIDRFNETAKTGVKTPVRMRVDGTMMKIDLLSPLPPGQTVTFDIAWHFNIPEHGADRMGRDGSLYE